MYNEKNQSVEPRIVPYSEAAFWQELGKWIAGIFTTAAAFFGMVNKWHGSRFAKMEKHIKDHCDEFDKHSERIGEQHTRLAKLDVYIETITLNSTETKDSIRRLHTKIDEIKISNG